MNKVKRLSVSYQRNTQGMLKCEIMFNINILSQVHFVYLVRLYKKHAYNKRLYLYARIYYISNTNAKLVIDNAIADS